MMQRLQSPRILMAAMVLVTFASLGLYYLDVQTGNAVLSSRNRIGGTYTLERAFESVMGIVEQAESGQRGFLLTNDPRYLATYEGARDRANRGIANIRQLDSERRRHSTHIDHIEGLVERKLTELDEGLAQVERGQRSVALSTLQSGRSEALMSELRAVVAEARADELSLLQRRQQSFDEALARRRWLRQALVAIVMGITLAALSLVWRVQRLQSFATVCAWSRTIQLNGEWVSFEEYLARRFSIRVSHGIAPAELDKLMTQIEQVGEASHQPRQAPSANEAA